MSSSQDTKDNTSISPNENTVDIAISPPNDDQKQDTHTDDIKQEDQDPSLTTLEHEENKLNDNNDEESKIEPVDGDNDDSKEMIKRRFSDQTSNVQQVFDPITNEGVLLRNIPNKIIVARGTLYQPHILYSYIMPSLIDKDHKMNFRV